MDYDAGVLLLMLLMLLMPTRKLLEKNTCKTIIENLGVNDSQ